MTQRGRAQLNVSLGLLMAVVCASPVAAQQRQAAPARDLSIKAFFGTFTGTGLAKTEDSQYFGVTVRDLDAKIEALDCDVASNG